MGDLAAAGRFKILEEEDTSTPVRLEGMKLRAIVIPDDWTAADVVFWSRPVLFAGDPQTADYALVFAIQVVAGQYRVLTEDERSMAEGLWDTKIVSSLHADVSTPVTQDSEVTILAIAEPRH